MDRRVGAGERRKYALRDHHNFQPASAAPQPEKYNKCLEKAWIIGVLNDTVIDVRVRLPNGRNVERTRERKDECGLYLLQAQPTTCKWLRLLHIMSVVPLYGQQHDAMRPERLRLRGQMGDG